MVRLCENLEAESEKLAAEEITNPQVDEEEEEEISLLNQLKTGQSLADRKAYNFRRIRKLESVKEFEEEELQGQLQNLRCIEHLKRTFSKFVDF